MPLSSVSTESETPLTPQSTVSSESETAPVSYAKCSHADRRLAMEVKCQIAKLIKNGYTLNHIAKLFGISNETSEAIIKQGLNIGPTVQQSKTAPLLRQLLAEPLSTVPRPKSSSESVTSPASLRSISSDRETMPALCHSTSSDSETSSFSRLSMSSDEEIPLSPRDTLSSDRAMSPVSRDPLSSDREVPTSRHSVCSDRGTSPATRSVSSEGETLRAPRHSISSNREMSPAPRLSVNSEYEKSPSKCPPMSSESKKSPAPCPSLNSERETSAPPHHISKSKSKKAPASSIKSSVTNRRLAMEVRYQIVGFRKSGHTPSQISKLLGITRKTVYLWIKRFEEEGNVKPRPPQPGPRSTTTAEDEAIVQRFSTVPFTKTRAVAKEYGVSTNLIRARLREAGLCRRQSAKK